MRLGIHHKIGKMVCSELKDLNYKLNEKLFLLGNIFPDLIQSYIWCRHEYKHSRKYVLKKIEQLKKRPKLFSFHLGVLTHYICDYFCYPHSNSCNKGFIHHIIYEIRQKVPEDIHRTKLNIIGFKIEELDRFVDLYERFCACNEDNEADFHIATAVASNFLQAAY